MEGDLFDPAGLESALEGVTSVVHLAAVFRTTDEDAIWRANFEGTRSLIEAVRKHAALARVLMASTCLVYNEDSARPSVESDDVHPKQAYPASRVMAEKKLQASGLNWSILRLPFVYGGNEHLTAVPAIMARMKWHPAQTFSLAHQRDVARAFELALTGAMDRRIVNIADDTPSTLYEMAKAVSVTLESSAEPLRDPWWGRADAALRRSLGFQLAVRTLLQAVQEGIL